MKKPIGKVYLVGAGPGDPGLMTMKGWRLLKEADVIIYDHLANNRLLDDIRKETQRVNVGKQVGKKILEQQEINKLLIREAKRGKVVIRLKGGDPFMFGRGGEEAQALTDKGIPFEVVPGITSAIAAPAYAGIPLTHRGCASSVAVVTGHEDPAKEVMVVNFKKIAQSVDTTVCLMGVGRMDTILEQIRMSGKSPETPVAIVERGTYAHQKVVEGTLNTILSKARKAGVKPPAVIVVGEVVKLRSTNAWFESLPLVGKTIVVTRAQEQAGPTINSLEQAGARVILFPTIEITAPKSFRAVDRTLHTLEEYRYIVFTSTNGVKAFLNRMHLLKKDIRCLTGITLAALGEVTAQALREYGLYPKIVPSAFTSRQLAAAFKKEDVCGKKVLLFRSHIAGDLLPRQLQKMGARVEEVSGYTIRNPRPNPAKLKQLFKNGHVDLITFTSPSTFTNFVSLMKGEPIVQLLKRTMVAAIGPVTKKEITSSGIKVAITASSHTVPSLVDAITAYYRAKKR
jgi:uroporphyrinogen III methyltransferase/synthase